MALQMLDANLDLQAFIEKDNFRKQQDEQRIEKYLKGNSQPVNT